MNLRHFTTSQREAILDLALLAMYADGHLASAEDERVHRLLAAMGVEAGHEQARQYDAGVARVRNHAQTAAVAKAHAVTLAANFTTPEHRRRVVELIDDLLASDSQVAPPESSYMAVIREAFQM